MHEVTTSVWGGNTFFAPLLQAFTNHGVEEIRGRIGRFTGTWHRGLYFKGFTANRGDKILFKLDRKTFLDRNANGKLQDEGLLLIGISFGVYTRKPTPIILGSLSYAGTSGGLIF